MYNAKLGAMVPIGGAVSAQSLTSDANIASWLATSKVLVKRFAFLITTLTSSSNNIVLKVYVRSAPGVTSGQVQVGEIVIPTAAAVGKVYYEDYTQQSPFANIAASLLPGQCLDCDVTTDSSSAGAGYFFPEEIEESPDVVANYGNHIAG